MNRLTDIIESVGLFGWLVILASVVLIVLISLLDRHPRSSDHDKRRRD